MDRYGGGRGYRDQSGDRRGGGDRYGGGGGGGGGYRDRDASVDRRGGGRGGRGGGSSRGGPRSFGGDSFHKAAGGDYQRMPESVAHPTKSSEHQAYGTEGRPIELVSNFYRLMNKDVSVMHYDITISKVRISRGEVTSTTSGDDRDEPMDEKQQRLREIFIKKFADSIMAKFIANNSEVFQGASHAYDGWKNLYTNKKLNLGGGDEITRQVEMSICDRPATFNIKLQSVGRVSMGEAVDFYNGKSKTPVSEQVIAVFDIIFRFVIGKSYATYQRKFFDLEDVESAPRVRLVDFVQGFISSVRSTEIGMALNVNLKTSAIISKQFNALMPFICEVIGVGPRDLQSISRQRCFQASKMIRHLKIFTNHSQRVVEYTVDALVDRFPQNETFDWKGRQVTYAEYFHEQYSVTLQKLPMVRVTKKNIHLPLELCLLKKGQFLNQSKIDGNIQREMLFKSTHTPNVYFHRVAQIINKIKEADTEHILADFGIDMDLRATRIEGRVLPTPRTLSANPRDRLYKSASMPPWGVFCFNETNYREDDLQRFVGQMRDSARAIGLNLPAPLVIKCLTVNSGLDIFNVFDNVSRSEMQMILIGLPSRNDSISPADMYNMVKHCCNQRFGLMNQCFSADKMLQLPGGYFNQFLLKVNAKIGGENSVIDPSVMARLPFNSATTMLVGLDVANVASDGDRLRPKVVAAVGSYNNTFTRYNAAIRVQSTTDSDAIDDLEGMIKDLIKQYDAVNHCLPKNMVIFRSGLSDPQFDTVHSAESEMIRRAAQGIKIVYIVVQMRHNARFALSQQNTSSHKPTYNVPSGTVVDKGIVNPARRCFYLNSHFSPLGTSRPTKYTIMRDDLRLSADDVQKLCFYSCYNSCRTRNVISRPTPVRYADLLCQRSKNHLDAQRATEGDTFGGKTAASTGSLDMQEIQERVGRLNDMVMLHGNVKNALFYC